jgi:hypothetical protein
MLSRLRSAAVRRQVTTQVQARIYSSYNTVNGILYRHHTDVPARSRTHLHFHRIYINLQHVRAAHMDARNVHSLLEIQTTKISPVKFFHLCLLQRTRYFEQQALRSGTNLPSRMFSFWLTKVQKHLTGGSVPQIHKPIRRTQHHGRSTLCWIHKHCVF